MTDPSGTGLTILTREQQVAAILVRDARRVQRLTWLMVGLWVVTVLIAVLLIAWFYLSSAFTFHTKERLQVELAPVRFNDRTPEQHALIRVAMNQSHQALAGQVLALAIGLLALSALVTVLLIHATRRATMRQIHIGLADISAQLADLRQKTAPPQPGG